MERHVVELEKRIEKTAIPHLWMDVPKIVCWLSDALEENASPEIWMVDDGVIDRLVDYFQKEVEKRGIGKFLNSHLPDTLIAIYFVYFRRISDIHEGAPEAVQSFRKHLKKCETCFPKVEKLYEKSLWGNALEQVEKIEKETDLLAAKISKKRKPEGWNSTQVLRELRNRK